MVAGDTVIRMWEYGGMVAWCSKLVVIFNFAGEECQVLGYMEIWWYKVACVSCVRCVGVRRYGGMVFQVGVRMEVLCRMRIARCIISWREKGTVARVTW